MLMPGRRLLLGSQMQQGRQGKHKGSLRREAREKERGGAGEGFAVKGGIRGFGGVACRATQQCAASKQSG